MFCGPQLIKDPSDLHLFRFYLDQCYNPHAIEFSHLYYAPTLPSWLKETATDFTGERCMLVVSESLQLHYQHSGLDPRFPWRLRHNAAVFYCPDRITVLPDWNKPDFLAAQLWAFKRIRAAACKRWLAAVCVIVSSVGPAIADCIADRLAAWHASLADADALPASALTYM